MLQTSPTRIVAREYAFSVPDTIPAGRTTIRLVNAGHQAHYALFVRLRERKRATDFLAWRQSGTPLPEWAELVSGPAPVLPGDSTDLTLTIPTGHYVALCSYPVAGGSKQHVDMGMVHDVEVIDHSGLAADPIADATLQLADSGFRLSRPLHVGFTTLAVENRGHSVQQALIVRLPDDVTLQDEIRWFDGGFRTARPGIPAGGVLRAVPGERYLVRRTFAPGRYAVLSHASGPWWTLEFTVR